MEEKIKKINKITIKISSPESILRKSYGEVLKPETINYRTHKPEKDGLFCERIFGPIKDYECSCGKYKRIRYKGIVCDRCGVEIIDKRVRRKRIGHINLVVPIVHIWFFRSYPNKIAYLLGITSKKLDSIIYYEKYVVIKKGIVKNVKEMDFLSEEEYLSILDNLPKDNFLLKDEHPDKFIAKMGGECLKYLLKKINLEYLSKKLINNIKKEEHSKQKKIEYLKRLQIIESFIEGKKNGSDLTWMIMNIIAVIPPELRPLVPLDGGRYASSDLNDLYRRVIIRNNRLKKLIEIKAPEVILRNEKRMLQESVDYLFDNSKKSSSIKSDSNRTLKSISDSLKGKQGRFRQNLLGKRVDYSARSVIVVGPHLKLHECGLPKDIAAELYKPFIIRKLIERGIVKTVKSAKKIIFKKNPIIWDILKNILKGHPVLLNRAPTLHRLGIQAFQPILIEGKAIELHPLSCAAFNADFDGDQMAVHLPLSLESILEAKILMLSSQNILNPANGLPITVPSQDMVLGLYYLTKEKYNNKVEKNIFSSLEEVEIAYDQKILQLHSYIKINTKIRENNILKIKNIITTVGRCLFNKFVPENIGFINKLLTKKSLKKIIKEIFTLNDFPTTEKFLDDIKELGFYHSFKGGLSFGLGNIMVTDEKEKIIKNTIKKVDEIKKNYNLGLITNNERYQKIINLWTKTNNRITSEIMKNIKLDKDGFNPVYMMLDSGARGSKEQIRQLSGMRGLMAKPQKISSIVGEIIENPIISNFFTGLTILEYFISTHGSRKGLADTALKTADAGYLTRRLVDAVQDVIIKEEDCKTIRGIKIKSLKKNEEIIESIYDRIIGRFSLNDVYDNNDNILVYSGELITEKISNCLEKNKIKEIYVRSPLTCESKMGNCIKCYGINLSNGEIVQIGEAIGVIAAQSIGEPGTQLTLRTFHVGGTAGNISKYSKIISNNSGIVDLEDLKTVEIFDEENNETKKIVISRYNEFKLFGEKDNKLIMNHNIPYGSVLYVDSKQKVEKGTLICEWDPYNAVIISEFSGTVFYDNIEKGVSIEIDEQTGKKIIYDVINKKLFPILKILDENGKELISYNLPLGAHLLVNNNEKVKIGQTLIKVPRKISQSVDITGGLPRLSELFEARNTSNPAIVSEIDGIVKYGKIKRGNREIIIKSKIGKEKIYLVKLYKQIIVQENDYIKAGTALSEGAITPNDILNIKGPRAVQKYLINELQEVYKLQGVQINDKHFEVIVKQMMKKVEIIDAGDSKFLEGSIVHKDDFEKENEIILKKIIIENIGDSKKFKKGDIINKSKLEEENFFLEYKKKRKIKYRNVIPAIAKPILQGVTKSSLQTKSFISSASFQETTKVLAESAIKNQVDYLNGLKENVIIGNKIPAGTGLKEYENIHIQNEDFYKKTIESI
ncbi:DNA-directed RNA polymerase subunit beta' [Candidatus Shikimatogenerans silvanidophilus]|uniref:DNA-directed RNA polymerase subunit beta' n=1 Tax=Candidatus Shikimatogenerans silvanidophilus TaxID=2782547 RepID=UPI001BA71622|nr:DNA-directed RNA polymerase subunit beta' [Candidatus Shikimatogenerans silvanidophilus]